MGLLGSRAAKRAEARARSGAETKAGELSMFLDLPGSIPDSSPAWLVGYVNQLRGLPGDTVLIPHSAIFRDTQGTLFINNDAYDKAAAAMEHYSSKPLDTSALIPVAKHYGAVALYPNLAADIAVGPVAPFAANTRTVHLITACSIGLPVTLFHLGPSSFTPDLHGASPAVVRDITREQSGYVTVNAVRVDPQSIWSNPRVVVDGTAPVFEEANGLASVLIQRTADGFDVVFPQRAYPQASESFVMGDGEPMTVSSISVSGKHPQKLHLGLGAEM